MKKLFNFALFGSMALTGAVGFSACSSSDDVVNPDFDPETNTVKTQFAISLPSNVNASKTRMSGETVQQTVNSFRGMQGIMLLPFNTTSISSSTKLLGDPITFSDNIAAGGLTALSGESTTGGNYKVFNDVTVPMGTSAFVFYAQALASGGTDFTIGNTEKTDPIGDAAGTAGYTFKPKQIFSGDATSTSANPKGTKIATYLTGIATVANWKGDSNLGDLYTEFIKMKAGSSAAVLRVVTDLWNSLKNNSDALSKAIVAAITNSTYASVSSSTLSLTSDISGYPANLNLPDGAAAVKWDDTNNKFEVDNSGNTVGSLNAYVYPASLWYTVNTPIRVATSKQADDYGVYNKSANTPVTTWDEALALYGTSNGSVSSTTRSIALVNPIQYAVGRLDVLVKCANSLKDQQGNTVNVPTGGFPVTAVLIGGQKAVNFAFTSPSGDEYTIYDKDVTGVYAKAGSSYDGGTNYTLALETAEGTDVNIAVEFENNTGADFYGKDGQVIPKDGKFYLTATLSASDATETGTRVFKQDYYTTAKLTIVEGSASSPAGLGVATNTIPDLRTPQLELGMSVNLEWQAGHEYDINFN